MGFSFFSSFRPGHNPHSMENVINADALKSEIRAAIINRKANACPIAVRLAWHASGTFDKNDSTGGSNGTTMRYAPESADDANAGLSIARDMLLAVKANHPQLSYADLWTPAGCTAIECAGGPKIPFAFGRSDAPNESHCPAIGRLPDASQGAQHLRDVFYRMGFNDQEIVCLSGAHTLGRCHKVRSGFDGPWTRNPLKFDNQYFKHLLHMKWKVKEWDGPLQYVDELTEELMMLPTDMVLVEDPSFRKYVEIYANDERTFFRDFADAYAKLISLGCPEKCNPFKIGQKVERTARQQASIDFREAAMHGSLGHCQKIEPNADVHELEASSGRSALHKAAFWGHDHLCAYLLDDCKLNPNVQDFNGDTALHDAARFAHKSVVQVLLKRGAQLSIRNIEGKTVEEVAAQYGKEEIVA